MAKKKNSLKGRKTQTQPIKWTQAQNLLKLLIADERYNDALLFGCGFYFGLRISDVLNLKWEDIRGDSFSIEEKKTGKMRDIDIHSDMKKLVKKVIASMDEIPRPDEFVFQPKRLSDRTGNPISVISANRRIQAAFNRYEITVQNPSSHTLRKTFGRRVYENNNRSEAALILLSQIFNHRDTATTRLYIGLTKEKISNAYLSL